MQSTQKQSIQGLKTTPKTACAQNGKNRPNLYCVMVDGLEPSVCVSVLF